MGCAHEAWERDTALGVDGLCSLCLRSMLDLSERRLAASEELRTKQAVEIGRLRKELAESKDSLDEIYASGGETLTDGEESKPCQKAA